MPFGFSAEIGGDWAQKLRCTVEDSTSNDESGRILDSIAKLILGTSGRLKRRQLKIRRYCNCGTNTDA